MRDFFKRLIKKLKRKSPLILSVGAVVGVGGTAYLVGKAAYKTGKDVGECVIDDPLVNWKSFIPGVTVGAATCAAIIASDRISSKQLMAAMGTASFACNRLEEYKESLNSLNEEQRKEVENYRRSLRKCTIAEDTGTGNTLFYDEFSGRYFLASKEHVLDCMLSLEQAFAKQRSIELNEWYQLLGIREMPNLDMGWSWDWGMDFDQQCIGIFYELTELKPNASLDPVTGYVIRFDFEPGYNY